MRTDVTIDEVAETTMDVAGFKANFPNHALSTIDKDARVCAKRIVKANARTAR